MWVWTTETERMAREHDQYRKGFIGEENKPGSAAPLVPRMCFHLSKWKRQFRLLEIAQRRDASSQTLKQTQQYTAPVKSRWRQTD